MEIFSSGPENSFSFVADFESLDQRSDEVLISKFKIAIDKNFIEEGTVGIPSLDNFVSGSGVVMVFTLRALKPIDPFESICEGQWLLKHPLPVVSHSSVSPLPMSMNRSLGVVDSFASMPLDKVVLPLTNDLLDEFTFSSNLIEEVVKLQENGKVDEALDLIYTRLDNDMLSERYQFVDFFLRLVNVETIRKEILIGILTITLPFKGFLLNREIFFKKVQDYLYLCYRDKEKVSRILEGLA